MVKIGRLLSVLGILTYLMLFLLLNGQIRSAVNTHHALLTLVNGVGAIGALSVFGAWFLSLYHWGIHFVGSSRQKRRWGAGLICGAFIGAWFYWLRPQPVKLNL